MSTIKAKAFQHPSATSNNITFHSDGTHTLNAASPITSKNLIINGGMHVWQRSTNTANATTTAYHTADRWNTVITSMGTWTQSRSTDKPSAQGFGYSLKMDCTTADASPAASDRIVFEQRIEGQNLQHLLYGTSSAKTITLSFWVKSNKTGTYIVNIYNDDYTAFLNRIISKAYTIDSASTWEKKTITIEGDTTGWFDNDNGAALWVQFYLGAGSDYTSGTLQTTWATISSLNSNVAVGQVNLADSTSNEWYVTGVQLEVGDQATGFEFEPYETIENKCMRYYEVSVRSAMGVLTMGPSRNASTQVDAFIPFKVRKRATPNVNESGVSFNTNGNLSTQGTRNIDVDGFNTAYILNGNQTSYASKNGTYTADAEL